MTRNNNTGQVWCPAAAKKNPARFWLAEDKGDEFCQVDPEDLSKAVRKLSGHQRHMLAHVGRIQIFVFEPIKVFCDARRIARGRTACAAKVRLVGFRKCLGKDD